MSKKTVKKTTKPLSPRPAVKETDTAYLVREELDEQQERLKSTTAAGVAASKAPAPAAAAEQPPTAAAPSKPLAPLAALWPSSVPPRGKASPSQGPAPQKAPVTAIAPKASPAAGAPPPKPLAQSAPPTTPEKSAILAQARKPTAAKTVNVSFALFEPNAKQVSLCGDFNGWASDATPMKRHKGGHWETTVALALGRHQYKFWVDGQWIPDPLARENVWNYHGSLNSVLEVQA